MGLVSLLWIRSFLDQVASDKHTWIPFNAPAWVVFSISSFTAKDDRNKFVLVLQLVFINLILFVCKFAVMLMNDSASLIVTFRTSLCKLPATVVGVRFRFVGKLTINC